MEPLVIGVGNPYRQDDGAGAAVVADLAARGLSGVRTLTVGGDPAALIEAWRGAATAIVVDATRSGTDPGSVLRISADDGPLSPLAFGGLSTHGIGLAHAVEMARALGCLPTRLVVYAIEGEAFGHGMGLSPKVERAVTEVAARVAAEVGRQAVS